MSVPGPAFPRPPAQVAPYVEVLGFDLTVQFLLRFGGAELYIPAHPQGRSRVEALVGAEKTRALAKTEYLLQRRVPLANDWVACCLHVQGWSNNDIARTLRITDITVRRYLKQDPAREGQS